MNTLKIYRAVLVGLGNIAWKLDYEHPIDLTNPQTHAGAYLHRQDVELVGGCSPDKSDRIAFESSFHLPTFRTLSELLDITQPDIISICSPSTMHFNHIMKCLYFNLPMIWLEKPACSNLHELSILFKYYDNSPSTILVNYIRRYLNTYNRLRDVVVQKRLGNLVSIHITYSRGLLTNGSHLIDQAFFLVGDPQKYRILNVSTPFDSENPWFSMILDESIPVSVIGYPLPYHCIDLVLVCEYGRASILHGGMTATWESRIEHDLFPGFYRLKQGSPQFLEPSGLQGCMNVALDDLITAYKTMREPLSCLRTANGSQAVIDEVLTKARS